LYLPQKYSFELEMMLREDEKAKFKNNEVNKI
jgi:hypothetical protein